MVLFLLLEEDLLEDRRCELCLLSLLSPPYAPYPTPGPESFDREDEDMRGALSSCTVSSSSSLSFFAVLGRRVESLEDVNGLWYWGRYEVGVSYIPPPKGL